MCALRELPSVLAKKAAAELNEDPACTADYLKAFREWLQRQPHLRSRTSDQFLIVFLRGSKFSLEKAKQKLENFYTYRSMMPEIFCNRDLDDPKVDMINKSGCLIHLPEPISEDGPRVVMIRPNCFDMDSYTIPDVFKVGTLATDILLYEDDNAIVAGYVLIMDLGNIPKAVLLNFDPNFVRKLTILANKINPTRMKGFHFLNVPTVFEKLFNMVKSVINVKLRERFYVHGKDCQTLYEHVPQRILPKEYGGEVDIADMQAHWWQKLHDHKDFLKEEESYGVIKDLKRACGDDKPAAADVFFGVQGSFRQLNLD